MSREWLCLEPVSGTESVPVPGEQCQHFCVPPFLNSDAIAVAHSANSAVSCFAPCGRLVVALAAPGGPLKGWPGQGALQQWAGTQLLVAGLSALPRSAAATAQAEVLQLLRSLLAQQLATAPGPRQVL